VIRRGGVFFTEESAVVDQPKLGIADIEVQLNKLAGETFDTLAAEVGKKYPFAGGMIAPYKVQFAAEMGKFLNPILAELELLRKNSAQ
jgi:hypothetical protein